MKSFIAIVLVLLVVLNVSADYDPDFCEAQLAKEKKNETGSGITTFFYDDYSTISETTFYKVVNITDFKVTHQQLYYSKSTNQLVLNEDTPLDNFWVFVDQASKDCIYKRGGGQCTAEEGDCAETANTVGFGNEKDGKIVIGSPSERMAYPTNIQKTVNFGSSMVREIKTIYIGLCSYREDSEETVVSLLHLLDAKSYPQMDKTKSILLAVKIYAKTPDMKRPSFQRVDFTDYKPLMKSQFENVFSLGENRCGSVKSKFTSRKLPEPAPRFLYTKQQYVTDTTSFRAYRSMSAVHEENMYSQINIITVDEPVKGEVEKNKLMKVLDFNGNHFFEYSITNGECKVSSLSTSSGKQPSSRDIWRLNDPNPTYLGVFQNRDIPCDVWRFDGPTDNKAMKSTLIFTATSDWLKKVGQPSDMFFPVQKIEKANAVADFQEIYGFKDNPGYHIPFLPTCFQQDDVVVAEVTLLLNYRKDLLGKFEHFIYEFRTLIMKIAGIVSPIRIGFSSAAPSESAPDTETIVMFRIYGKLNGFNDSSDTIYRYDPVTSQKAAELINTMVDKGNMKFSLDNEQLTVNFKKGSFAVVDQDKNPDRYRFYGSSDGVSGYSSGAMAGAAIGLLVSSLTLSLAAAFGYKRWRDAKPGNADLGMKTLQEDF